MDEAWWLAQENSLRLGAALTTLALFALLELWWPARPAPRWPRWGVNFTISLLDTLCLRLLMPVLAVGAAMLASTQGLGLLPALSLPHGVDVLLALLLLDLLIYWQHRLMHVVPVLWRLHRMHHSDLAVDVSTALRFHPLEILLSMALKIAAVLLIGAPVAAVVLFEILLNGCAVFNHANLALPRPLDRILQRVLMTPRLHRIHHSSEPAEHNRNYGFTIIWWDWLFRSYCDPGRPPAQLGLARFRAAPEQRLGALLAQPLRPGLESGHGK